MKLNRKVNSLNKTVNMEQAQKSKKISVISAIQMRTAEFNKSQIVTPIAAN